MNNNYFRITAYYPEIILVLSLTQMENLKNYGSLVLT